MERIIDYEEIPSSKGESIYIRLETDPKLYLTLLNKGYRLVSNIMGADSKTIYVTGKRQAYGFNNTLEYKKEVAKDIEKVLSGHNITKPKTYNFNYNSLINYKYRLPFVLKNENRNGGKEKFLIRTEKDYENVIKACTFLINRNVMEILSQNNTDSRYNIDYEDYLKANFTIQEYIETPSIYNTTVRLLTTPSNDLLYGSLKYKERDDYQDHTSLLGYLLKEVYPISTKSIVSNTISGGNNILLGENYYKEFEHNLLSYHNIDGENFYNLVESTKAVHSSFKSELGIICGFDYIYDINKEKWFLLEYHERPMLGDYSKRQGLSYNTKEDRMMAEGRIRATALTLTLKKH